MITLLNFGVFVGIMVWVYLNKVAPMLIARSQGTQEALNRVRLEEQRIEGELASLRSALETVDNEEQALAKQFKEEGEKSAEAIRRAMLEEVQQIEKDMEQMKVNLLNQLEADLRDEITARAVTQAGEKLSQMFTPEMDKTLRTDVLRQFAR
jgi:F0F1-type ATP synthase membrane subunit b/b'